MNVFRYRCGWCGHPCDVNGIPYRDEKFQKAVRLIEKYGDKRMGQVHGQCCPWPNGMHGIVTREMAMDAGDLSLEGQVW